MGLYQHLGASLDGADYWATSAGTALAVSQGVQLVMAWRLARVHGFSWGLAKVALAAARVPEHARCESCHTPHEMLPTDDPRTRAQELGQEFGAD